MTTAAQLRKTALSLPEATEQATRSGAPSFTVGGKQFAALGPDRSARLHLPAGEASELLAQHPAATALSRGGNAFGASIPLAAFNGQQLNYWVLRAWLWRAPKRLADRMADAQRTTAGTQSDLPRSIGKPATRALASIGITTLAQAAELPEAELLALHGVGPKAVRVLQEALVQSRTARG